MTDPEKTQAGVDEDAEESPDDDYAPTPFDNPFFLPVVLLAFAVWFTYDGWFNPEMEWIKFNRGGAAVSGLLGVYFTVKAIRERRAVGGD